MSSAASALVNKVWNYCNLLRDDGVSYGDYVEQLTFLLFLKMDYERTRPAIQQEIHSSYGLQLGQLDRTRRACVGTPLSEHARESWQGTGHAPHHLRQGADTKSGAGQYFTPRVLIDTIVEVMRPKRGATIIDPAAGTGGFLLAAATYILKHHKLDPDQTRHLQTEALYAVELVAATARICAMNLLLHGLGNEKNIAAGRDSLAAKPSSTTTWC
jgi:type I restriction enzyme M protein